MASVMGAKPTRESQLRLANSCIQFPVDDANYWVHHPNILIHDKLALAVLRCGVDFIRP